LFPQAGPAYALGPPVSVSSGPGRTPSSGAVLTWQLKKAKRRCADGHRGRKARGNRCRRPWSGTVSSSVTSAGSWSLMNPSREVIHHHTRPGGSAWRDGEVRRHLAVRGMDPHVGHLHSSRTGSGHVPCCAGRWQGNNPSHGGSASARERLTGNSRCAIAVLVREAKVPARRTCSPCQSGPLGPEPVGRPGVVQEWRSAVRGCAANPWMRIRRHGPEAHAVWG